MNGLILAFLILSTLAAQCAEGVARWHVYFSPKGGCTDAIVSELTNAKQSVLVQAYSFTSEAIARALVDAHKRGVKIQVILDKGQKSEKYSSADFVAHAGIDTFIDSKHPIAHNKVMVIDSIRVITGSFNFTKAAEESNAENLLVLEDPKLAAEYAANWRAHLAHCAPYIGKGSMAPIEQRPRKR